MTKTEQLLQTVRDILFYEWDPIGVNDNEMCRDEYDSYAPTICQFLREGTDEYKLTHHLNRLQRLSMGLSEVDEEHNRRIAQHLLNLVS